MNLTGMSKKLVKIWRGQHHSSHHASVELMIYNNVTGRILVSMNKGIALSVDFSLKNSLSALFCKVSILLICVLEACPHTLIPYVNSGCNRDLYINSKVFLGRKCRNFDMRPTILLILLLIKSI